MCPPTCRSTPSVPPPAERRPPRRANKADLSATEGSISLIIWSARRRARTDEDARDREDRQADAHDVRDGLEEDREEARRTGPEARRRLLGGGLLGLRRPHPAGRVDGVVALAAGDEAGISGQRTHPWSDPATTTAAVARQEVPDRAPEDDTAEDDHEAPPDADGESHEHEGHRRDSYAQESAQCAPGEDLIRNLVSTPVGVRIHAPMIDKNRPPQTVGAPSRGAPHPPTPR